MKDFFALKIKKSAPKRLAFTKSEILTFTKSRFLDLAKFLDLARFFAFPAMNRFNSFSLLSSTLLALLVVPPFLISLLCSLLSIVMV